MAHQFDGGTLLYVLGIGFGLAALAYFVRDVVFSISITVRAALLFLLFLAFLFGSMTVERDLLDRVFLALAGAAYVVFLGYVSTRYAIGSTGIFLLLAGSAGLFVGLGYGVRTRRPDLSGRTGAYVLIGIVGVGLLLIGADVATAGMTATVELEESATVSPPTDRPDPDPIPPGEAVVGTVTVENEGPFTRPLSLPEVTGCLAGVDSATERSVSFSYKPRSYERRDHIRGGQRRTVELTARLPVENETRSTEYRIERGSDCDGSWGQPTLIVNDSSVVLDRR